MMLAERGYAKPGLTRSDSVIIPRVHPEIKYEETQSCAYQYDDNERLLHFSFAKVNFPAQKPFATQFRKNRDSPLQGECTATSSTTTRTATRSTTTRTARASTRWIAAIHRG
eukprot:2646821-Rhodomonas_salina.1